MGLFYKPSSSSVYCWSGHANLAVSLLLSHNLSRARDRSGDLSLGRSTEKQVIKKRVLFVVWSILVLEIEPRAL